MIRWIMRSAKLTIKDEKPNAKLCNQYCHAMISIPTTNLLIIMPEPMLKAQRNAKQIINVQSLYKLHNRLSSSEVGSENNKLVNKPSLYNYLMFVQNLPFLIPLQFTKLNICMNINVVNKNTCISSTFVANGCTLCINVNIPTW